MKFQSSVDGSKFKNELNAVLMIIAYFFSQAGLKRPVTNLVLLTEAKACSLPLTFCLINSRIRTGDHPLINPPFITTIPSTAPQIFCILFWNCFPGYLKSVKKKFRFQ